MRERVRQIMATLPRTREQDAWVGVRWRVGGATICHLFGGEDQRIRITFKGAPDEVNAFTHLGDPYFKTGWGDDTIGMIIDDATDWHEVSEMLQESHALQTSRSRFASIADEG